MQLLPDLKMSFNLKLAVLMFFIFPFSFYFNLALFFALKPKYINERLKQPISESPEFSALSLGMMSPSTVLVFTVLEWFSFECRKTKTKVITQANHIGHRQYIEPIKTRRNYMWLTQSAGKCMRARHNWLWFYF